MKIDWSKALGAQWYCQGDFYKRENRKWYWSCGNGLWLETDYASPENFGWWGHRIPAPEPWNGEGPPPPGTDCEFLVLRDGDSAWTEGEILYSSPYTVVISGNGFEHVHHPHTLKFRPVRTPKQIAAEERRAGIEEMREILHGGRGTDWATYLYDAGYRKQEQP